MTMDSRIVFSYWKNLGKRWPPVHPPLKNATDFLGGKAVFVFGPLIFLKDIQVVFFFVVVSNSNFVFLGWFSEIRLTT